MAYKGKYLKPKKRKSLLLFWIVVLIIGICGFVNSLERPEPPVNDAQTESTIEATETPTTAPIETTEVTVEPTTEPVTEPTAEPTEVETEPTDPEPEPVVYEASIGAMGNLVMHKPLFDVYTYGSIVQQPDGTYNFESIFKYIDDDISKLDYAVVNLETTLSGKDNGYPYGGYPSFNCPDSIVTGVKDAGFDMLLTANNHSSDTEMAGYKRTLEVIRGEGVATLGTYLSAEEAKWTIKDINGVNVGMMCYTWASDATNDGRPSLNWNDYLSEPGLCNYFCSKNLDAFYEEVEQYVTEMKEAGADATMMFIHWGEEYRLSANEEQKEIAQRLCDMGIDVIVGSHPYVIQPIELIESTVDPNHKTVCIYSTGNAVSNLRGGSLTEIKTAHTEDGIVFSVTFEKVDDGEAYISDINVLPTWVNMHIENDRREYNILPLDMNKVDKWQEMFGLNDEIFKKAKDSYDRTMEIVGKGLDEVKNWVLDQRAVG